MVAFTLKPNRLHLGPHSAGLHLTARQFDRAKFVEGWCYELIHGVLVVSPPPLEMERDPNEELGRWLRNYQEDHPQGKNLDKTLPEQMIRLPENRRRADRAIWVGLDRLPTKEDVPTILVEFVSKDKRDWLRDYVEKRDEYLELGVREYWIIDRFQRTLTVFIKQGKKWKKRLVGEKDVYCTPLLPGFELPLAKLLALADGWEGVEQEYF